MTDITIPYAIADFADLRQRGFYYVDKTRFIPELERYNAYRMRSYVVYMAAGKVLQGVGSVTRSSGMHKKTGHFIVGQTVQGRIFCRNFLQIP